MCFERSKIAQINHNFLRYKVSNALFLFQIDWNEKIYVPVLFGTIISQL